MFMYVFVLVLKEHVKGEKCFVCACVCFCKYANVYHVFLFVLELEEISKMIVNFQFLFSYLVFNE